jgi:hypothetical protein
MKVPCFQSCIQNDLLLGYFDARWKDAPCTGPKPTSNIHQYAAFALGPLPDTTTCTVSAAAAAQRAPL